jgi:uncharacterized alpha-E superfamily protein
MLSRVANSLYWMGRYLERAEHSARVLDVNLVLMLDQTPEYAAQRWNRLLRSLRVEPIEGVVADPQRIAPLLIFDRGTPLSLVSMLTIARDNARQVRNQLSSEMWEQVNRLYLQVSSAEPSEIWDGRTHTLLRGLKEGVQLFHGIAEVTMRQDEGWHFLRVGRFLERTLATAALLEAYFGDPPADAPQRPYEYLDWVSLLKSRTAFEAYCQVYTADLQAERIAAFLLLNAEFALSARFAVERVQIALAAVERLTRARNSQQIARLAGRMRATFDYAQIHTRLHEVYFQPPIEAVLAS